MDVLGELSELENHLAEAILLLARIRREVRSLVITDGVEYPAGYGKAVVDRVVEILDKDKEV